MQSELKSIDKTPATRSKKSKNISNLFVGDRPLMVYDADMTCCYSIPMDRVVPCANPIPKDRQLTLCTAFATCGECPSGDSCTLIHAHVDGCEKMKIHINYAWKTADNVPYARLCAGETISVLAPNNRPPMDVLASELVLVTKGSLSRAQQPCAGDATQSARPLSHCAHYYFNRVCNRGDQCSFIHAINIDSNAELGQLAPAPQVVQRSGKAAGLASLSGAQSAASRSSSTPQPASQISTAVASEQSTAPATIGTPDPLTESGYASDGSMSSVGNRSSISVPSSKSSSDFSPSKCTTEMGEAVRFNADAPNAAAANESLQQPRHVYRVCDHRVLIISPENNQTVGFRYNPYRW